MNRRISFHLVAVIYLCFTFPLVGRENPYTNSPEITSARIAAIGGLHSALADDLAALFNNPAGFRSVGSQFSATEATFSVYGPFDGIFGGAASSYCALQLLGPISVGYVGNGFGVGLFNTSSIRNIVWGGTNTSIDENFILAAGYSYRIPLSKGSESSLDVGVLAKLFMTTRTATTKDISEVLASYLDISNLASYRDGFIQRVAGVGVDLGILYSYKGVFSIGLVGRNCAIGKYKGYATFQNFLKGYASSAGYVGYAFDLSAGVVWKPQLGRAAWYIKDFAVMLDYRDIIDFLIWPPTAISPLLHISLGLEFRLLEILSLRAGFYQCLPSAGVGLDLSLFTLNVTVFGLELSDTPWGSPIYNTMLGVEFRY